MASEETDLKLPVTSPVSSTLRLYQLLDFPLVVSGSFDVCSL